MSRTYRTNRVNGEYHQFQANRKINDRDCYNDRRPCYRTDGITVKKDHDDRLSSCTSSGRCQRRASKNIIRNELRELATV